MRMVSPKRNCFYYFLFCLTSNIPEQTQSQADSINLNKYLLPSSCHPPHTTQNIPFSLALRIIRICSEPEERDARLLELKDMLLTRDYPRSLINAAVTRALEIPRQEALKKVVRENNSKRPIFVVTFDPRLPSLQKIMKKHWRTMITNDPHLKEVFPSPPLVAYKKPKTIRSIIIRAKVPRFCPDQNMKLKA